MTIICHKCILNFVFILKKAGLLTFLSGKSRTNVEEPFFPPHIKWSKPIFCSFLSFNSFWKECCVHLKFHPLLRYSTLYILCKHGSNPVPTPLSMMLFLPSPSPSTSSCTAPTLTLTQSAFCSPQQTSACVWPKPLRLHVFPTSPTPTPSLTHARAMCVSFFFWKPISFRVFFEVSPNGM